MDRRWFLGASAGSVILSATRASHAGSARIGDIGVQLYTVRGELERDFEGTLLKIAEPHTRFPLPLLWERAAPNEVRRRVRGSFGLLKMHRPLTRLVARSCSQLATLSHNKGRGEERERQRSSTCGGPRPGEKRVV